MTAEQWRKRIEKLEGDGHKLVLKTIEKCEKEHGNCCEKVADTISAWFAKYATDGKVSYVEAVRLNRMLELIDCIENDLEETSEKEDEYLDWLVAAVLALYSKRLETNYSLDNFRTAWMSEGIWYSDELRANKTMLLAYILGDLKKAFARGDSLTDILKQLKKRFKTSTSSLNAMIQDEVTDYEADMLKDFMTSNGYSQYQWITVRDGRQCDDCDAMDGLIFHVKDFERGVTAPKLHRRCRCQIAPFK